MCTSAALFRILRYYIISLSLKKESRKDRIRQSDETGLPCGDKIVPFIVPGEGKKKFPPIIRKCTKYNTQQIYHCCSILYIHIIYIYMYLIYILRECALARSLIYTVKFGRQFGFKSAAAADLSLILLRFLFICARAKSMVSGWRRNVIAW